MFYIVNYIQLYMGAGTFSYYQGKGIFLGSDHGNIKIYGVLWKYFKKTLELFSSLGNQGIWTESFLSVMNG